MPPEPYRSWMLPVNCVLRMHVLAGHVQTQQDPTSKNNLYMSRGDGAALPFGCQLSTIK
jgi:hypothetical protein